MVFNLSSAPNGTGALGSEASAIRLRERRDATACGHLTFQSPPPTPVDCGFSFLRLPCTRVCDLANALEHTSRSRLKAVPLQRGRYTLSYSCIDYVQHS